MAVTSRTRDDVVRHLDEPQWHPALVRGLLRAVQRAEPGAVEERHLPQVEA